jgi:hypothetical protein
MEIFVIRKYSSGDIGDRGEVIGYEMADNANSAKQQYADKIGDQSIMDTGYVSASKMSAESYLKRLDEAYKAYLQFTLPIAELHKEMLLKHLKGKRVNDVVDLWAETKNYYYNKGMEMGGSYASFGDDISVRLYRNNQKITFKITMDELRKNML